MRQHPSWLIVIVLLNLGRGQVYTRSAGVKYEKAFIRSDPAVRKPSSEAGIEAQVFSLTFPGVNRASAGGAK